MTVLAIKAGCVCGETIWPHPQAEFGKMKHKPNCLGKTNTRCKVVPVQLTGVLVTTYVRRDGILSRLHSEQALAEGDVATTACCGAE